MKKNPFPTIILQVNKKRRMIMNSIIYYFSGTGNSFAVARDIANVVKGELKPIPVEVKKEKVETDAQKIVIVFPVYAWGPPVIVREFVKKIEDVANKKIFVVMTYGGSAGATVDFIKQDLALKNGSVASNFGIKMVGNCITLYGAPAEEKQKTAFEKYIGKMNEIVKAIDEGTEGLEEKCGFLMKHLFSGLVYKGFLKGLPKMDKKFYSDEKCTKCKICSKVCPAGNIDFADGKPVWKGSCEQCMACIQWCPAEAIQYGKSTVKRRRYHHPDVKISDMMKHAGN